MPWPLESHQTDCRQVLCKYVVLFIVIIELSGVQFCPKSYACFQNQMSALHGFDFEMTNMISGQNCTKRSSIITLLQPF